MSLEQTPQGSEAILVVEDSPQVRTLIHDVLEMRGYRVFEASTSREALEIAGRPGMHIDLLLTDVVMPGMNGPDLAKTLTARQPGLIVLFASGHAAEALAQYGVSGNFALLEKPFSPDTLARKVRDTLDSRPR